MATTRTSVKPAGDSKLKPSRKKRITRCRRSNPLFQFQDPAISNSVHLRLKNPNSKSLLYWIGLRPFCLAHWSQENWVAAGLRMGHEGNNTRTIRRVNEHPVRRIRLVELETLLASRDRRNGFRSNLSLKSSTSLFASLHTCHGLDRPRWNLGRSPLTRLSMLDSP